MKAELRTVQNGSSRRAILAGAGSIGVLTVLAACASPAATDPTGTGTGPAAPGGDAAGPSSAGPEPNGATPSGPVDLGRTKSIPVGGGVIFGNESVVVTQPIEGTFRAFSSTCTHQGCTVGSVSGGLIMCPCHGSEYSIVDGSVKSGPAPLPLPRRSITISDGSIFLKT